MFTIGTRVKVTGHGRGAVADLVLEDGQAFAVVDLDNGGTVKANGPELVATYR